MSSEVDEQEGTMKSIEMDRRGGVWGPLVVLIGVMLTATQAASVMSAPPAAQPPPDQSSILLATVDYLPWAYEVLGLVEAAMGQVSGIGPTARLMARLRDQALAWSADAVIGIRLSQLTLPGASRVFRAGWFGRVEHSENMVVAIAIGTAVRQLPPEHPDDAEDVGSRPQGRSAWLSIHGTTPAARRRALVSAASGGPDCPDGRHGDLPLMQVGTLVP
jgi:hypothetical protein